jgi:hypothetical protein
MFAIAPMCMHLDVGHTGRREALESRPKVPMESPEKVQSKEGKLVL